MAKNETDGTQITMTNQYIYRLIPNRNEFQQNTRIILNVPHGARVAFFRISFSIKSFNATHFCIHIHTIDFHRVHISIFLSKLENFVTTKPNQINKNTIPLVTPRRMRKRENKNFHTSSGNVQFFFAFLLKKCKCVNFFLQISHILM